MIRAGLISLFALSLVGCEMINYDQTADPAMTQLINQSYVINKDSFLLENYCLNEYTTSRCLYMQAVGGSIRVFKGIGNSDVNLPKSFEDYEQNKDTYNDSLRDDNIFHRTKYEVITEIPKGTLIKITRVVSISEGESGRAWAVFGQIESLGPDVSIQIGSGHLMQDGPNWFASRDREHYNPPPQPLPDFLSPLK